MNNFIQSFNHHAINNPDHIALKTSKVNMSYAELKNHLEQLSAILIKNKIRSFAFLLPNSIDWLMLDLAAIFAGITAIPVPHFFSDAQIEQLLLDAGVDCFISSTDLVIKFAQSPDNVQTITVACNDLAFYYCSQQSNTHLEQDVFKISYTSGSTSQPKGVKISAKAVDKLLQSLQAVLKTNESDQHLCILPFSLLLENIAGAYLVLSAGGQCIIPTFDEIGLQGSSSFNGQTFAKLLVTFQPTTMICVPAQLKSLISIYEAESVQAPHSLRYVAVGGAPVSEQLLSQARGLGLPVYQGYGLTESSSVVALNLPSQQKSNSVGKVLPHITVKIIDNEIVLSGANGLGYLNQDVDMSTPWHTGDLGKIDKDGYLFIEGRKKTVYCSAFGRNISPEWLEGELATIPFIVQSMVLGESLQTNIALIVINDLDVTSTQIDHAINTINGRLPDYARIGAWQRLESTFSLANQYMKPSGVINRQKIMDGFSQLIENLHNQYLRNRSNKMHLEMQSAKRI